MTEDHTYPQHGDIPDAANFAQLLGVSIGGSCIREGLTFTVDFINNTFDVSSGTAIVVGDSMDTSHPSIDPSETRSNTAHVIEFGGGASFSLTNNSVNEIWLDANVGTDSTPTIEVGSVSPSQESFKIGEIDTTNDTKSEQWNLVSGDGTLTFPNESAIDSEDTAGRLPVGTNVYDRSTNSQYVITG